MRKRTRFLSFIAVTFVLKSIKSAKVHFVSNIIVGLKYTTCKYNVPYHIREIIFTLYYET